MRKARRRGGFVKVIGYGLLVRLGLFGTVASDGVLPRRGAQIKKMMLKLYFTFTILNAPNNPKPPSMFVKVCVGSNIRKFRS